MQTPKLIIVTGRPGAGKTALATRLATVLRLPMISRDIFKEGFAATHGIGHAELPTDTNQKVTEIFFSVITRLLRDNISLVAEAAFQHKIWTPKLGEISHLADIRLIICDAPEVEVRRRLERRLIDDPDHARLHGTESYREYETPKISVAMMMVDTAAGNGLLLENILNFIKKKPNQ